MPCMRPNPVRASILGRSCDPRRQTRSRGLIVSKLPAGPMTASAVSHPFRLPPSSEPGILRPPTSSGPARGQPQTLLPWTWAQPAIGTSYAVSPERRLTANHAAHSAN